ncbi:MAG TPA: hypothetical protein VEB65_10875 [Solirubrobacterales bacterium]|nr:hypothetical protein [Solirubrobacterales bacterium]
MSGRGSRAAPRRDERFPALFVADGGVMPTQGAADPALTIKALASRLGERLTAKRTGEGS